jgi:proprotein convertase subtilisin/kexin type 5
MSSFVVTISNINIGYISVSSTSFTIYYLYNGLTVAQITSGVTVSPYCTSPCQRCVTTKTACATCLPSPNTAIYFYPVNSSCTNACPNGYYPDSSRICNLCVSPCVYCTDTISCTKCVANYWLYSVNNTCMTTCPSGYYNDSSGNCVSCSSPCLTCLTNSSCTSCSIYFYTNYSCVLAANCPSGTYANITTLKC